MPLDPITAEDTARLLGLLVNIDPENRPAISQRCSEMKKNMADTGYLTATAQGRSWLYSRAEALNLSKRRDSGELTWNPRGQITVLREQRKVA